MNGWRCGARPKFIQLGALALISALVLAGCGEGGDENSSESRPRPGGTLIEAIARPTSDDPAMAQTVSERVLADHLYDGLTRWDSRTLSTQPAIAQRWEPGPENKQWTFHLRDAVASNGEPVTATDVKTSLERVARASSNSPSTDLLAPIAGFPDFSTNDAVASLTGITVVDPKTVKIDLQWSVAELPKLLGNAAFGIVHRNPAGEAVTTGPFMVKDRSVPDRLQLQKAPGSPAFLDGIEMRSYDNVSAAYAAFKAGGISWAPVPPEAVQEAGAQYGTNLFRGSLRTVYLSFNLANPKFADPRVREAITRAIDRNAVQGKLNIGDSRLLNGIVPQNIPGSQSGACGLRCVRDVDAAKALMAQVFPPGSPPPPPINLDVALNAPFNETSVTQVVADLAAIGITVNPRFVPATEFGPVTVAPEREMFQASWSAAYPSADAFLPPLFFGASTANVSGLKDPAIDAKIDKSQASPSAREREGLMQEIEREVMAQLPMIPIAQFPVGSVATPDVRGLDPSPTGSFNAANVWLNQPAPAPAR